MVKDKLGHHLGFKISEIMINTYCWLIKFEYWREYLKYIL